MDGVDILVNYTGREGLLDITDWLRSHYRHIKGSVYLLKGFENPECKKN